MVRRATQASNEDWESNVASRARRDEAAYRAAVEAWIGRWSDKAVEACAETRTVPIPQMDYALGLRETFLEKPRPGRSRRGRALRVAGGSVAAVGAGLVVWSGTWWAGNRNIAQTDGDTLRFFPEDEQAFRRFRAVNIAGGVALGVGLGTLGAGVVAGLTDAGAPMLRLRVRR
ncbi:MAG: hypothetical protein AAF211_11570 [Myxococcota bacterium]